MAIIKSINMTPEIYWKESEEFRVFLSAIDQAFDETFDKTERITDCLDPLQVQENLISKLAHRMGFVYDWRFQPQFNRLVLHHFPSMIYNRGSITGVSIGALTNLASLCLDELDATSDREFQYFADNYRNAYDRGVAIINQDTGYSAHNGIDREADPKLTVDSNAVNFEAEIRARAITEDRLDDTSLPNNAVAISVNTDAFMIDERGRVRLERNEPYFINVIYFSETVPVDACLEYVRPMGMYLFQHAGVKLSAQNRVLLHPTLGDQFNNHQPVQVDVWGRRLLGSGSQRINPNERFSPSIYGGVGDYNRTDFATIQQYAANAWLNQNASNNAAGNNTNAYRNTFNPQNIHLPHGLEDLNPQAPTVPWNDGDDTTSPATWTDPGNPPKRNELNHPLYQSYEEGFNQWLADNALNIENEIGWDEDGKPIYDGVIQSVLENERAIRTNSVGTGSSAGASGSATMNALGSQIARRLNNSSTSVIFKRIFPTPQGALIPNHSRKKFWSRNSSEALADQTPSTNKRLMNPSKPHQPSPSAVNYNPYVVEPEYDAGYNTLYSMQLSNNEHIIQRLMPKVFELGYLPTHTRNHNSTGANRITVEWMDGERQERVRMFNLQYADERLTADEIAADVIESDTSPMKENLLKGKIRFGDDLINGGEFVSTGVVGGSGNAALNATNATTAQGWAFAPSVNPTLENIPTVDTENTLVGTPQTGFMPEVQD
jgi:hypothetical protein